MNNSKKKLFFENFLFYGGLSMLTKALPFITLPIITKMLPNASAYGIADMFNLVNSFGIAIAILGMHDAIFREYFEEKDDKNYQKKVTSTGLGIVLLSGSFILIVVLILQKKLAILFFKSAEFQSLLLLSSFAILIGSVSAIISAPTRMKNERRIYLYTGISFPVIGFILTYSLIKIGYTYRAIVYSNLLINLLSLTVFFFLNKRHFNLKFFDKKIARELLKIGIPLLPTFLIYWVFNSMDRMMINRMLGPTELGVYSVGAKIASISQLIYTAFTGGWQYFLFSTMKDKDQVEFNSKIFEYLGVISFFLFTLSFLFVKPVFKIFFVGEYIRGSEVFPYLFLSPLLLMLFQILASQILIIKKSYLSTVSLLGGAVLNILLNYILIKKYGMRGAAISTLISYFISLLFMMIICIKLKLLILSKRFIVQLSLVFYISLQEFYIANKIITISIVGGMIILIIYQYSKEIKIIMRNIKEENR